MQDRYVGDVGDYVKYALLRSLSKGKNLGVAWYLYPDESHNDDGKHIHYLSRHPQWRVQDPELFDVLCRLVTERQRSVCALEETGVLGAASFSNARLNAFDLSSPKRHLWRAKWFDDVLAELKDCDVVFADPDNGLCEDEKFSPGRKADWKRLPLSEAKALAENRTAILYHHNTRRPGGHAKEVEYWLQQLGEGSLALRWRPYSPRTFFVVNPTDDIRVRARQFAEAWSAHTEFFD